MSFIDKYRFLTAFLLVKISLLNAINVEATFLWFLSSNEQDRKEENLEEQKSSYFNGIEVNQSFHQSDSERRFFNPTVSAYKKICGLDDMDLFGTEALLNNIEDVCHVVMESDLCRNVKQDARLQCDHIREQVESDVDSMFGCLAGGWDALVDVLAFVWQVLKWLTNPYDTLSASGLYMDGVKSYLGAEWAKAKEETDVWEYFHGKAVYKFFKSVIGLVYNTIDSFLEREYSEVSCLNRKARWGLVCQIIGNLLLPGKAMEGLFTAFRAASSSATQAARGALLKGSDRVVEQFFRTRLARRGREILNSFERGAQNVEDIGQSVRAGVRVAKSVEHSVERIRHPFSLRKGHQAQKTQVPHSEASRTSANVAQTRKVDLNVSETSRTPMRTPQTGRTRVNPSETMRTSVRTPQTGRTSVNASETSRTSANVPRSGQTTVRMSHDGRTAAPIISQRINRGRQSSSRIESISNTARDKIEETTVNVRRKAEEVLQTTGEKIKEGGQAIAADPFRYLRVTSGAVHSSRAIVGRVESQSAFEMSKVALDTNRDSDEMAENNQTLQFESQNLSRARMPLPKINQEIPGPQMPETSPRLFGQSNGALWRTGRTLGIGQRPIGGHLFFSTPKIIQARPLPTTPVLNARFWGTKPKPTTTAPKYFFNTTINHHLPLSVDAYFTGPKAIFRLPPISFRNNTNDSFRNPASLFSPQRERSEKIENREKFNVGDRVSFRNWEYGGGLMNAVIARDLGSFVDIHVGGTLLRVLKDQLHKPMSEEFDLVSIGDSILFNRFYFFSLTGIVTEIKDGKIKVSRRNKFGNIRHYWIGPEELKME